MRVTDDNLKWISWKRKDVLNVRNKVEKLLEANFKYVKNLDAKNLSFVSLFQTTDSNFAEIQRLVSPLHQFELLHPGKELREMSRKEVLKISEIFTKYSYKQEVYLQVKKYYETVFPKEKRKLSKEEIMIVEDSMRSFKRMGLHLPKDKRDKIVSLKNQKSKLSSEYQTNSTKNYDKGIWFSLADLDGLSAEAVAILRHDPKKKKYFVSLRPGELLEVLKHCKVERTRDRITELRAKGVGEVNSKKLRQILKIRVELSKILGFKTPAHFYMSEQMVSDPSKAKKFCIDLLKDMTPKFIKEKEEAKKYLNIGEEIKSSNFLFLETLAQTKNVKVDEAEIKKYFETEATIEAMFDIWLKLFGVKVVEDKKAPRFDKDVKVYKCLDAKTKKSIGVVIFDLYPRVGKYGHACVSPILTRYVDRKGNVYNSSAALVCNFTKSKSGKSFLNMDQVGTLFHEGGHLLHKIISKNNYLDTNAFSTSTDFVEIPSQFMEHFPTTLETNHLVASHIETGKPFSKELISKIGKVEDYFIAYKWIRQCVFSLFDLELHGKNALKYATKKGLGDKFYKSLTKKYIGIQGVKNGSTFSNFPHIVGGYESKYNSYVISRVYAEDVWNEFLKKRKTKEYKKLLEAGSMEKEIKMLTDFLGRPPNNSAFINFLKNH